jgi:hypothetical protein
MPPQRDEDSLMRAAPKRPARILRPSRLTSAASVRSTSKPLLYTPDSTCPPPYGAPSYQAHNLMATLSLMSWRWPPPSKSCNVIYGHYLCTFAAVLSRERLKIMRKMRESKKKACFLGRCLPKKCPCRETQELLQFELWAARAGFCCRMVSGRAEAGWRRGVFHAPKSPSRARHDK